MPFDGNGNYTPPTPAYPAVAGTVIEAANWNTIVLDLASALSSTLIRDGQAAMLGTLNMGAQKIQNLADGVAAQDAVAVAQVLTAAVTALKALTPAADKFPFFTSGTTADMLTIVSAVRTVLAAADVAAMRTAMGLGDSATLAVGTTAGTVAAGDHAHASLYQPLDDALTALAALTTAADQLIYATASDTFATTALTAFARTLLDDADAATMRTTLGAEPADADILKRDVSATLTVGHTETAVAYTSGDIVVATGQMRTVDTTSGVSLGLVSGVGSVRLYLTGGGTVAYDAGYDYVFGEYDASKGMCKVEVENTGTYQMITFVNSED